MTDCPRRQHLRVGCPADDPAEHRAPCICNRVANGAMWHTAECEASWTTPEEYP